MFYINFQRLKNKRKEQSDSKTMSLSDDVIDWPLPNKIIGCVTVPTQ